MSNETMEDTFQPETKTSNSMGKPETFGDSSIPLIVTSAICLCIGFLITVLAYANGNDYEKATAIVGGDAYNILIHTQSAANLILLGIGIILIGICFAIYAVIIRIFSRRSA